MRFAFFGNNGRVEVAVNDSTQLDLPAGAIELTEQQWEDRFNLSLENGALIYNPIARPVADIKAAKIAQLEKNYRAAVQQPVAYMGTTFQADTGSQAILTATLVTLNASGAVPPNFGWWDINNVKVPMTLAELNGLAGAMFDQGWVAFQKKQTKKADARNAANAAQANAVAW